MTMTPKEINAIAKERQLKQGNKLKKRMGETMVSKATGIGGKWSFSKWLLFTCFPIILILWFLRQDIMLSKLGIMILAFAIINGWFWFTLLMTYVLRDESHKIISANMHSPLGMDDGDPRLIPPLIKNGEVIEPQYVLRTIAGINILNRGIHTAGRVLAIYPYACETRYPGGGVVCNCNLRAVIIEELPEHIQDFLQKEAAAIGVFKANEEIWFAMTPYYANPTERERFDMELEGKIIELNTEISRLKNVKEEQGFQYILSIKKKTKAMQGDGVTEDVSQYHQPSENIFDQSTSGYNNEK